MDSSSMCRRVAAYEQSVAAAELPLAEFEEYDKVRFLEWAPDVAAAS